MFGIFYPKECADSTYEIDFEALYEQGYRGVLFDIDNTLVPHGMPADKRARELFDRLRKIGFHTCLISNNKEPRVKPFAKEQILQIRCLWETSFLRMFMEQIGRICIRFW